jgi:hypothetical protein
MDSATIGIRGGMIVVAREPEGILAIFLAGSQMRVVGASREERVVQRPGDAVVIDPAGRVTRPFQITAEQRAKVLRRLSPNTPDAQPVDESRMHNGAPPLGVHGSNGSVPVGSTSHPANETVTTPSGAAPPPTPGAARPKSPSLPLSRAPAPLRVSPSRPPVPPRKRRQLKSIAGKEQRSRARAFDAVCRRRRCR